MAAIGYASLPITPSLRGLQKAIRAELEVPLAQASAKAGQAMEKTLVSAADNAAKGVERARKREIDAAKKVEDAEKQIQSAKQATEKTTRQVEAAEKNLQAVRQKGKADVAKAEADVAKLRDSGKASTEALTAAEEKLKAVRARADFAAIAAENKLVDAREKSIDSAARVEAAEEKLAKAKARALDASDNVISASQRYDTALQTSAGASVAFASNAEKIGAPLAGVATKLKALAPAAAGAVGIFGAANFFGDAVTKGREFDTVLGTIKAVSGATAEEMAKVNEKAKELGKDSELAGTSQSSAAAAMLSLTKGGLSVAEAMDAAKGSIQLAGAAMIDGGQAADIQVAAMSAFKLGAEDATRVADVLVNTANAAATDVPELAEALKYAGGPAGALGVSLEDTNTMLGLFANQGIKGSMAGTAMAGTFTDLLSPSKQSAKALKEMGIEALDADGKFVGLRAISGQLADAQKRMGNEAFIAASKVAFGETGVKFATTAAAAGAEGFDELRDKLDKAGSAGDTAGSKLAGLNGAMEEVENALDGLKQSFYENVAPFLTALAVKVAGSIYSLNDGFNSVMKFMRENKPLADAFAAAAVGVSVGLAAWAVQQRIVAAGGMLGALKQLVQWTKLQTVAQVALNTVTALNPFAAVALAITATVAALGFFLTKTETGQKLVAGFGETVKHAFSGLVAFIKPVWVSIVNDAKQTWSGVVSTFNEVKGHIQPVIDAIKIAVTELFTAFKGGDDGYGALSKLIGEDKAATVMNVITTVQNGFNAIRDAAADLFQKLQPLFDAMVNFATGTGSAFVDVVKSLADTFTDLGQQIGAAALPVLQTLWNDVIVPLGDALKQLWELALQPLLSQLKELWAILEPVLLPVLKAVGIVVGVVLAAAFFAVVGSLRIFAEVLKVAASVVGWVAENVLPVFIAILGKVGGFLIDLVQNNIERFKVALEAVGSVIGWLKDHMSAVWQVIVDVVSERVQAMLGVLGGVKDKITGLFATAGTWLKDIGSRIIDGLVNGIKAGAGRVGSAIKSVLPGHVQGFVPQLALGGQLPGYATGGGYRLPTSGPGTNEVDGFLAFNTAGMPVARLDAGEWVINGDSSQKYARELAMINAGTFPKLPGFADGGFIAKTSDEIKKALESVASPYIFGGWSEAGVDCSGAISLAVNVFRGLDKFDSRTATAAEGAWLVNKGFSEGRGGEGDFRVAFRNGGPGGGHTAAQLPDGTFIESGGNTGQGLTIGGKAGPLEGRGFTDWYYAKGAEQVADALSETASAFSDNSSAASTASSSSSGSNFGKAQELFDRAAKHLGLKSENASGVGVNNTGDPLLSDENRDAALGSWNGPDWGPEFFAHEIARSAKDAGLGVAAAIIGVATTLVESGNPLKMWANNAVPESLSFRHDAVGSDADSIGLFQQRQAGWGTVEDRMTPFKSAGMFFDRLKQFDWENMDPGAAAQKVQVSAFPDKYAQQMDEAKGLVARAGVYDTGGILPHGVTALNLSHKPEVIINNDQLTAFSRLSNNLGALVPVLERAVATGDFRGGEALGLSKNDPLVDAALKAHEALRTVGGEWADSAEIVQDAERGLAETRKSIAAELSSIKDKEAEVAELRKQVAELEADEGGLSVQSRRKIQDAEEALANARAKGKADQIANAEKRLARAREDADAQLDKSDAKNAKKLRDTLQKLNKAEDELAITRKRSEDAAKRLEAAERTVIASRVTAIGGAVQKAFEGVAAVFNTIGEQFGMVSEMLKTAEAARQEVSKLQQQQRNEHISRLKSYQDARVAEWDVFKARMDGLVNIAQAEHAVEEARIAATMRAGSSLNALGGAIDRFRDTGVFRISEITDEMVDSSEEVTQANAALARVRAEALLAEHEAQVRQTETSFALAEATLQQFQTAQLLEAATMRAKQQAADFYGLTSQGANRAQRGFTGVGKLVGGLGKLLGGLATGAAGFLTMGPAGALLGAKLAIDGIKDAVSGGMEIHTFKDDIREGWNKLDIGGKVATVLGAGIQGASGFGGAYLSQQNPEVAAALGESGAGLGSLVMNSRWQGAQLRNERAQSLYEERLEKLNLDFAKRKAELEASKAARALLDSNKAEELKANLELAKLGEAIAKASTKDEARRLADAAEVAAARRDELVAIGRDQSEALRAYGAERERLTVPGASGGPQVVEITLRGSAMTSEEVAKGYAQLGSVLKNVELRVTQLEDKSSPVVGGLDYHLART
ncbi:phage tail tape measure protein [Corynebacterium argentoratense]|uniref:phage tail tape measure protein n=1 Tax=Corynebacterium argentoratense TaxID=42817 RepID=UPI001F39AB00|nr:phage tail tape measure protein [Corynebacterium argentoratense]MCF1712996.1 phage tail tape measure protein [Corynebacterium argentoratense]